MSASRNDITGKPIFNKASDLAAVSNYDSGWDRIFGRKECPACKTPVPADHIKKFGLCVSCKFETSGEFTVEDLARSDEVIDREE